MSGEVGYHRRGAIIGAKIFGLFSALVPSTYDEVSPMIEYWIEFALTEQSVDAGDLVEQFSLLAWESRSPESNATIARFLKEFRAAPHRSEQARSCIDRLCDRVFRSFGAASAENLVRWDGYHTMGIAKYKGHGFIYAASFIGHLIECGLLDHGLIRRHLIKPLITHQYANPEDVGRYFRAMAIYHLFIAARDTLLQGFLEPEDVEACFKTIVGATATPYEAVPDAAKLNELREFHAEWLKRKEEEQAAAAEIQGPGGEGDVGTVAGDVPAEVETPIAPASQDLPAIIDIGIPSSLLRNIEYPSVLRDAEHSSAASTSIQFTATSSPTLSISTISDLTPTELDDGIGDGDGERTPTPHESFYLGDGNVEVVCGHTIFRIHSSIVSFSSSKLRDMLSPSTLLDAPMPEGCPRVVFKDSAEDFAVLLKMIFTPGFVTRHKVPEFATFASLLRMAAKYGFSDVREALVEDLKGAYPTKWEDFETARVLGEDVFGSPKPHPNAVLNLFLEQNIKFALPFAAYRACLGGFSSLVSDRPGTVLPRLALISIIHGMGAMNRLTMLVAHGVVYMRDLGVCPDRLCVLNTGIESAARRDVLKEIFSSMYRRSERDMLSPSFEGNVSVCMNCADRLENLHHTHCEELVWEALPVLLGWGSWEGV